MPDQIVNTLGFEVDDALKALESLDGLLDRNRLAFEGLASAMTGWNRQASTTIDNLRSLVAAAKAAVEGLGRVKVPTAATSATPSAAPQSPSLWLPSGVREEAAEAAAAQTAEAAAARTTTAMRDAAQVYSDTRTPQEQYISQLARLDDLAKKGAISQDTHTRAVRQAKDALQDATKSTNNWVVSWETLARVVATQFLVRMMSEVRDLLKDAVTESLKFQKSIAEIRTIAPAIDQNFNSLAQEVSSFARSFNFPVPQVSEALYQTISNQFTTASQRADIMTASAKLAKVGVMELNDAVLLITGTLNAYGMSSSQAESVAAKFFKTIELGRLRGAEMTNVIGQLVPIASQVGVSLDEVNASMISMTIGGMKVPQAATAIRAGMSALLKPSDDLKRELREMGYESGVQLVRAKGLQEAFLTLANSVDGDVAQIAKLFRNIRALNAELRLTGTGADQAQKALEVLHQTSGEVLEAKYKEFTSTSAEAFTKEVNKLKTALATDIGGELVKLLNQMIQMSGGADTVTAALKAIVAIGIPVSVALGGIAAAMGLVSLHAKLVAADATLLGAAFNNLVGPIAVFVGAMTYFDSKLASALAQADEKFTQKVREHLATLGRASEETLSKEKERYDKSMRTLESYLADVRKAHFKQVDDARDANAQVVESSRQTMTQMIATRERVVTAYRNAATEATRAIKQSTEQQADLTAKADDAEFAKRQKQRSASEQLEFARRRGLELADEASKALGKAASAEDRQAALALFQRANAYLQESQTKAQAGDELYVQERAERDLLNIIYQQIEAEKKFQATKEEQAKTAANMAGEEQGRVDRMKVLMKTILDSMQLFTKQGPKDVVDRNKQTGTLRSAMAELEKLWLGAPKLEMSDLLAFDSLQRRVDTAIEGGVSDVEVKNLFASPESLAKLNRDITGGLGAIQVKLDMLGPSLVKPGALVGKTEEESLHLLSEGYRELVQKAEDARRRQEEVKQSFASTSAAILGLRANYDAFKSEGSSAVTVVSEAFQKGWNNLDPRGRIANITEAEKQLAQLMYTFQQIAKSPEVATGTVVKELQAAVDVWTAKGQGQFDTSYIQQSLTWAKVIQAENERRAAMNSAEKARGETDSELIKKAEEAKRWIETLLPKEKLEELKTSAQGVQGAMSQVPDMSAFAQNLASAAESMRSIAESAASLPEMPGVMTAATGGKVWAYLAGGGYARGADTQPAMLSPHEVVMNERAARRFSSQLVAMNAGLRPSFHSQGGSVTNIGDINVTVSGGGSSRQTARSIASELRRELRRGTSTL